MRASQLGTSIERFGSIIIVLRRFLPVRQMLPLSGISFNAFFGRRNTSLCTRGRPCGPKHDIKEFQKTQALFGCYINVCTHTVKRRNSLSSPGSPSMTVAEQKGGALL